jgi:hypothetical protein
VKAASVDIAMLCARPDSPIEHAAAPNRKLSLSP